MNNALLFTAALLLAAPAAATTLTVTFSVTDAPTGQIMLSLYDNEAAHDGGGTPVAQAAVPVANGQAVARFPGLAAGRYAIKAFHDIDGDGKMGMTPFGMPTEPFAFSNNAPAVGGPAPWSASHFAVDGDAAATAITIR
ncbi:MAG: DUF2141 domain-containing protein [Alphaproteobacteria bacterium]|nr:DUF2141 domain-containing protein [Alphaproteobacteria bacterium]